MKIGFFTITAGKRRPRISISITVSGFTNPGGTQSPSLGIGIGMGYVPPEFAKPETVIEIEIRGRRFPAVVVKKPIFKKADK